MPGVLRCSLVAMATAVIFVGAPAGTGTAAVSAPAPTPVVAGITPSPGDIVGVAMPVTVRFATPIGNRAAAERSIHVTTATKTQAEFRWINDNVVQLVPVGFWPAHSNIGVSAFGFKSEFGSGASVVGVASVSEHTFTVSIDDQVARVMPASMGKPKYPTPVGSFTALEKQRNVTFDSRTIGIPLNAPDGYLIKGEYAVRVTWGGVYVHSAPWSVGSQGKSNVSHGCINLSPDNAAWYFNNVNIGDPIIVNS
jgi:lipoprotein-anchoring transpeptidase ErfK/SrfK